MLYDTFEEFALNCKDNHDKEYFIELVNRNNAKTVKDVAKKLGFATTSRKDALRAISLFCGAKIMAHKKFKSGADIL